MGKHVANRVVKLMTQKGQRVKGAKVLVLGITFKENCPDIRNSKVIGVIHELQDFGCDVAIHDPWADAIEVRHEYGLTLCPCPGDDESASFGAVVLAVSHDKFKDLDFRRFNAQNVVIFDIKSILPKGLADGRL